MSDDRSKVPHDAVPPTGLEAPEPVEFRIITRTSRFLKWRDVAPGHTYKGVWLGTRPANDPKYEDPGVLKLADGTELVFGMPTALKGELLENEIPTGTWISIRYDGRIAGKKNSYHGFTVGIDPAVTIKGRQREEF
jgi:hypothetical protein